MTRYRFSNRRIMYLNVILAVVALTLVAGFLVQDQMEKVLIGNIGTVGFLLVGTLAIFFLFKVLQYSYRLRSGYGDVHTKGVFVLSQRYQPIMKYGTHCDLIRPVKGDAPRPGTLFQAKLNIWSNRILALLKLQRYPLR